MKLDWKLGVICVVIALGTGAVIGSQAFPKTITETIPAEFQETNCIDLNTMEKLMDTMLVNQVIFEKTYCWQEIIQDENGQAIIIGNCNIPQRGE